MTILLYDLVGEDHSRPFSPHCWKTTMCLAHKGLDYRRVPTPFTSVPNVEGGTSKTVPVIRDGDRVVADSFTIALYLEETYPDRPSLFGQREIAVQGQDEQVMLAGQGLERGEGAADVSRRGLAIAVQKAKDR